MNSAADFCAGPGEYGLVSVVIPTFQRATLIERAIDSVLDQTYRPVEVIVADDGSTDDTRRRVEAYGPPVRYLHQANAGVSAARNLGLRAVNGEFIGLLDSDDAWLPWKLDLQVSLLRAHPEAGMVWTDMSATDDDGHIFSDTYLRTFYDHNYEQVSLAEIFALQRDVSALSAKFPARFRGASYYVGDIFQPMMLGNLVHTSTVLLRRERLRQVGLFDETLRVSGEDYEFHLRTCYHGPVALIDLPTILYRVGGADQLTGPKYALHMARNNLQTLDAWLLRAADRVDAQSHRIRHRAASSHRWLGGEELRVGNHASARLHLRESLRLEPWQPGGVALLALTYLPRTAIDAGREWRRRWWKSRKSRSARSLEPTAT